VPPVFGAYPPNTTELVIYACARVLPLVLHEESACCCFETDGEQGAVRHRIDFGESLLSSLLADATFGSKALGDPVDCKQLLLRAGRE